MLTGSDIDEMLDANPNDWSVVNSTKIRNYEEYRKSSLCVLAALREQFKESMHPNMLVDVDYVIDFARKLNE